MRHFEVDTEQLVRDFRQWAARQPFDHLAGMIARLDHPPTPPATAGALDALSERLRSRCLALSAATTLERGLVTIASSTYEASEQAIVAWTQR